LPESDCELKDKVEIKASTKGKSDFQKDYDETVIKKMQEFREMNQGRGANGWNANEIWRLN
jgi:hypothetical protein